MEFISNEKTVIAKCIYIAFFIVFILSFSCSVLPERIEYSKMKNVLEETEISNIIKPLQENKGNYSLNEIENKEKITADSLSNSSESNESLWVWFVIIGVIILFFILLLFIYNLIHRYRDYLYKRFDNYDIFSLFIIIGLLLLFGAAAILLFMSENNETGFIFNMPCDVFKQRVILGLLVTVLLLFIYNLIKTKWYFAILNVVLQVLAVAFTVIIIAKSFLGLFFSSNTSKNSVCKYCGSNERGNGCPHSPRGIHEHILIEKQAD